jgi:hypothetical protein
MAEKLDLDVLARLASGSHVSGYNAVAPMDVLRLIARIRALESRASNAGGAVGTVDYSCSGSVRWREGLTQGNFPDGTPLYTHPAPASKEPVADERAGFEAWLPTLDGSPSFDLDEQGYYDEWSVQRAWAAWQARAALATAQTWQPIETAPRNVPVLVLASGQQFVAWFQDDATDEMYDESFGGSDHNKSWCVTDNKHGPYALRGGRPTHWIPLPAAPAKPEGV